MNIFWHIIRRNKLSIVRSPLPYDSNFRWIVKFRSDSRLRPKPQFKFATSYTLESPRSPLFGLVNDPIRADPDCNWILSRVDIKKKFWFRKSGMIQGGVKAILFCFCVTYLIPSFDLFMRPGRFWAIANKSKPPLQVSPPRKLAALIGSRVAHDDATVKTANLVNLTNRKPTVSKSKFMFWINQFHG